MKSTHLNYFSRTLINNLLKDTTGISVSTKHFANDLIIFEDNNLRIEMFIEQATPNSIPEFCYTPINHNKVISGGDTFYTFNRRKILFFREIFNRIRQKSPILYRWVMNAVRYEGYRW